jgi:glycosyltransferase involved in cell wall biosynthesis
MVLLGLEALREMPGDFEVHHVNAKFSNTLEEIGDSSFGKFLLTLKYLAQALRIRTQNGPAILYYVPGPVKWSAVLRDWLLLTTLRLFYSRVVFHWHAIGHGEWAHGSERLKLTGPRWVDSMARKISAWVLDKPFASISVSSTSQKDSLAVASKRKLVVFNGIKDPCPAFEVEVAPQRLERLQKLTTADSPYFKILFLSHGTLEKGITDALDSLAILLNDCDPSWQFQATFAGGVSDSIRLKFDSMVDALSSKWPGRIQIIQKNYLTGDDKHRCFVDHDIFLAPSRWESFGLTVSEAMAYGMQIVATASDGVQGVLPEDHPYLSPVGDVTKLAKNLQDCCEALRQNPELEQARALRERFLSRYQINNFSENFTNAFLKLSEKREASSSSAEEDRRSSNIEHQSKERSALHLSSQNSKSSPLSALSDLAVHPSSSSEEDRRSQIVDRRSENPTQSGNPESDSPPSVFSVPSVVKFSSSSSPPISNLQSPISLSVYLADQTPGHDRSFGISRMSQVVLDALQASGRVVIQAISSKTSQQAPSTVERSHILPWGTRSKWVRLLTDHFHPFFASNDFIPDLYYFPKGYLPWLSGHCQPSVVTIHDAIIQYDKDHYPKWRVSRDYAYWEMMLKHTLRNAGTILTVSESSKRQISTFIERHALPKKEIHVTYEPCFYETIPQPVAPTKKNHVIHLASCEPHKRSAHLIRWWHQAESQGRDLPMLHLIGQEPDEVSSLLASTRTIVKRPFLEDTALQAAYQEARALILPSEIEGFGLPALEAYYLGTPVCYVKDTSVEEILRVATEKGGFSLDDPNSLFTALEQVIDMSPEEIRQCGFKLRETYAAEKVAKKMIRVFEEVREKTLRGLKVGRA